MYGVAASVLLNFFIASISGAGRVQVSISPRQVGSVGRGRSVGSSQRRKLARKRVAPIVHLPCVIALGQPAILPRGVVTILIANSGSGEAR